MEGGWFWASGGETCQRANKARGIEPYTPNYPPTPTAFYPAPYMTAATTYPIPNHGARLVAAHAHPCLSLDRPQALNLILLTAAELGELRQALRLSTRSDASPEDRELFAALFACWCHNPVATFSLCLLAQAYEVSAELVKEVAEVDISVGFLMQVRQRHYSLQRFGSVVFSILSGAHACTCTRALRVHSTNQFRRYFGFTLPLGTERESIPCPSDQPTLTMFVFSLYLVAGHDAPLLIRAIDLTTFLFPDL